MDFTDCKRVLGKAWRIFQIGEPVIKYKESGSIMEWIKYIKENKRKRK